MYSGNCRGVARSRAWLPGFVYSSFSLREGAGFGRTHRTHTTRRRERERDLAEQTYFMQTTRAFWYSLHIRAGAEWKRSERERRNTSVLISFKTNIGNGGCMQSERGISNMPPAPFLMASTSAPLQIYTRVMFKYIRIRTNTCVANPNSATASSTLIAPSEQFPLLKKQKEILILIQNS